MSEIRAQTAVELEQRADRCRGLQSFVGLDGFVDEIFHVVDKRENAATYTRVPTIARFAERTAQAAGRSTNVELVSQRIKLGGNGPILANALAQLGLQISYLGNLGYPNLHPVFQPFGQRANVHSIAEPGYTDALEFEDGKLMMGKHQSLGDVNWDNIVSRFGVESLRKAIADARLICFVNWTMLTSMTSIWESIQREIVPGLDGERRLLFIDLADPEKRTKEDIVHALRLVERFQQGFDVILGLNEKESTELTRVLDLPPADPTPHGLADLAEVIRVRLRINTVVIHPVRFAVAADERGRCMAPGPFTPKPLITTGAGDHFNAGFCLGRSLGLSTEQSLWAGVGTSGFYVRTANSPSMNDLLALLRDWPETEVGTQHGLES